MNKVIIPSLIAMSIIHILLFICHANKDQYLWLIDLLVAALCLVLIVKCAIGTTRPKKDPPAYSSLSTPALLKTLQKVTDDEKKIERELELRYPETHFAK